MRQLNSILGEMRALQPHSLRRGAAAQKSSAAECLFKQGTQAGHGATRLVDGVAGLAARHDVVHHALEQAQRGQRPRADGEHALQGLPQQIPVELREQLPVRLRCRAD